MGEATLTTSDGEEHNVFACDVCGQAPVLQLLEEHPDHDCVDDMFWQDDSGDYWIKDQYINPEKVYNPLSFDETGLHKNGPKWTLCNACRKWVEYMLNGALAEMFEENLHGE